jgi:HD-GYP domain-containing protein (c-di-GMP phosphodiesterase class II)
MSGKLAQAYEEVNFLFRLARFLNYVNEPVKLVQLLIAQIHEILPFQWIAARFLPEALVKEPAGDLLFIAGTISDQAMVKSTADEMLALGKGDHWSRILVPGEHLLATSVGAEVLAEAITHDGRAIGLLLAGNKTGDDPDLSSTETQILTAIADFLGIFHENAARFAEQHALFLGTLQALTSAIDAKDRYTRGHSERVGLLAEQMARALTLPDRVIEQYRVAGLVHDVGKIGIAESVLRKTGQLTDAEFSQIKAHPQIGHDILRDIPPLAQVLPGVLHHHERWDGRGYPSGLSAEQIPLIARVLALADTFDAMTSDRSYRRGRPRHVTLAELQRCAGTQFDPGLVGTFTSLDFSSYDAELAEHNKGAPIS